MRRSPEVSASVLTLELERLSLRAVRRVYEDLNASLFKERLRAPAFELSDAEGRLGRWSSDDRTLELRRTLLVDHGWGVLVEVLKHEMAHQFVDEVLGMHDEPQHGPVFRQVCEERGIDARAAGAPAADRARDHVLERIAKLLALAESPNEHEAQAAMSAAQRLMLKHNIDSLLDGKKPAYGFRHLGAPSGRVEESERLLAGILGDHFFVQVIWVPVWRPLEGKRGSTLEVCGTPDNLELAEYVYAFVTRTADRLWEEYRRERAVRRRSDRARFRAGVMSGFRERLERDRKRNGTEGLVWKGDADLHVFFRSRHPHIRFTRHAAHGGSEAYTRGRDEGRKLVLHRGVHSGPSAGAPRLLPPKR
ncbi:MAG TPA: DUF2786 domain-containing protein [Polyangiaceae bacterium]|nr:DUF2786 domain-containing protein [Polyangiaceae bacterium]